MSESKVTTYEVQNAGDTCALLIWKVPKALKRTFKEACVRQGTTMQDAITALMDDYVRNH